MNQPSPRDHQWLALKLPSDLGPPLEAEPAAQGWAVLPGESALSYAPSRPEEHCLRMWALLQDRLGGNRLKGAQPSLEPGGPGAVGYTDPSRV